MTNYLALLAAGAALLTAANPCVADSGAAPPRYVQAATGSALTFTFDQAGAANKGAFRQFNTQLAYDEGNHAASSLNVTVQISSIDTQDQERDESLRSADLFDAAKFPTAVYVATSLERGADGKLHAAGKLTLRGVTRELRLPLKVTPAGTGVELSGETTIRRLDYGVGQGDWKSTEAVGDAVKLQYKVSLVRAK
jgi:polyisoprenoid-binding protein YceI